MVRKFIKKCGYKLLKFIIPEIKILRQNLNWDFISYSLSENKIGKTVNIGIPAHISNASIGDYSYIAINSWISLTEIGKFCSIGPNFLCGWGIHPTNGISTSPMFYSTLKQNGMTLSAENKIEERKTIKIGNDVFIGANVTVLDGITIGDGAVIGAGSVVSKDIPPYAIAVGSPIRIIRYRFNQNQIENLSKIKWWNFDINQLKEVENDFFQVEDFIRKYKID
ncbi:MAG: acetyltransferase (isoleucine patch superfamily) [Bacteroidetes bacterium]|nr:acetyltransferase (isoleucine patch superfamily) [Bacteroidota bacterium]